MVNEITELKLRRRKKSSIQFWKYLFFGTYFSSIWFWTIMPLFSDSRGSMGGGSALFAALLFGEVFAITLGMKRQRIFRHRAITIFILGTYSWLFYILIAAVTGLFMVVDANTYKEFFSMTVFTTTLFLLARIIIVYDWRKELIMIYCVALGIAILSAFIRHGGQFSIASVIGSFGNILMEKGRYRYAFGMGHVNSAGQAMSTFFMMSSMYRAIVRDKDENALKSDKFNKFFLRPLSVMAFIILMGTASRAPMSSTILFYMVYFYLNFRSKISKYFRVLLVMAAIMAGLYVISRINWEFVGRESGRMESLGAISMMIKKDLLLTGLGFVEGPTITAVLNIIYGDTAYLKILEYTGLVGFILLCGTIFWFVKAYFEDTAKMTRIQRCTGAMFAAFLYYHLFEGLLFGHGFYYMTVYMLVIVAMNEKVTGGEPQKPCETAHSHIA